jgi:transcriptional regulator with XRE-family HTH domain
MPILEQLGGLSMAAFGRKIGVDKDTVRDWVKGRTKDPKLTIPQMKKLVKTLQEAGISIDDFPDSFSEDQTETP